MFEIRMLLVFLVYSVIVSLAIGQQLREKSFYCGLSSEHTICENDGLGSECLPQFMRNPTNREVSADEAMEIVAQHNRLRNEVAGGQTNQSPAANMRVMQWDSELASIAQRWADQCKFDHDCSNCRNVGPGRAGSVGQSIGMSFHSQEGEPYNWESIINSWFNEIEMFPTNETSAIERYEFDFNTGHYTQLVWARSDRVGCGVITYTSEDFERKLYVCNYGESGNFLNEPIYTIGEGCSECPGRCSSLYNSLCEAPRTARSQYSNDVPSYSNVPLYHGSYPRNGYRYHVPVPSYSNVPLYHGSYPRYGNRYNVPVPSYSNVQSLHGSYQRYGYSFPRYYYVPIQNY